MLDDGGERTRCFSLHHVATLGGPLDLRVPDELPGGPGPRTASTGEHQVPSIGHLAVLHAHGGADGYGNGTPARHVRVRAIHRAKNLPAVGAADESEGTDEGSVRTSNAAPGSKSGGCPRPPLRPGRSISSPDLTLIGPAAAGDPVDPETGRQTVTRQVMDRLLLCDTSNLRVKLVEVVRVRHYRSEPQDSVADGGENEGKSFWSSSDSYHLHVQLASDTTGWPCASARVTSGRLAVLETVLDPLKNLVKLIVSVYHSQRALRRRLVTRRPSVDEDAYVSSCARCRGDPIIVVRPPSTPTACTAPSLTQNQHQHQQVVNGHPNLMRATATNTGSTADLLATQMLLNGHQPEYDEVLLCEGDAAWVGGVHLVPATGRLLVSALAFEHLFELEPDYSTLASGPDPYNKGLQLAGNPLSKWGFAISGSSGSAASRICYAAARSGVHLSYISRPSFKSVAVRNMPDMLIDFAQNDDFFVVLYKSSKVCHNNTDKVRSLNDQRETPVVIDL